MCKNVQQKIDEEAATLWTMIITSSDLDSTRKDMYLI